MLYTVPSVIIRIQRSGYNVVTANARSCVRHMPLNPSEPTADASHDLDQKIPPDLTGVSILSVYHFLLLHLVVRISDAIKCSAG